VVDEWMQHENWYNGADTQAGDDLYDHVIRDLSPNTAYCWRVRYRDRGLSWSDWSVPQGFETGASSATSNLVTNPGAESGTTGWTTEEGIFESLNDGQCDGVAPRSGQKYFSVGGVCNSAAVGRAQQDVDLSMYASQIASSTASLEFGTFARNFNGSDRPSFEVIVLDDMSQEISRSARLDTLNSQWTNLSGTLVLSATARTVRVVLHGERNAGTDNDSYFDDVYVRLDFDGMRGPCDEGVAPVMDIPDAGMAPTYPDAEVMDATNPDALAFDDAMAQPMLDAGVIVQMDASLDATTIMDAQAQAMIPATAPKEGCACQATSSVSSDISYLGVVFLGCFFVLRRRRAS